MIVALRGKLVKSSPLSAVLDVGGVYYGVNIPITTAEKLPKLGSETFLHTFAVYREDSQTLYGFATEADRDFFAVLVEKVSGIGPKIALNMLSRMSSTSLKSAIAAGIFAFKVPWHRKKNRRTSRARTARSSRNLRGRLNAPAIQPVIADKRL